MPFIWSNNPNLPTPILPTPVPPGEVSYEVDVVANTVNAGGTLSYNTPNVAYDVLYQLPSANINTARFTLSTFDNITVNTANITTASINLANITTANILNANILYGYVGSDPTSNLQLASKHYVDQSAANVPTGGSDLQNIIDAKGDLLVGSGFHTAIRLPVGSDGEILISDNTSNSGLRWIGIAGQEQFNNLMVQTHYEPASNDHVIFLRFAGEIVMNDGTRTAGWLTKTADIEVSGAGGLDTGSETNSAWYEVHAIRNSISGNTALLLHRASNTWLDQSFTTTTDLGVTLKKVTGGIATKIAQSFIPTSSGPLTSVELELSKTGSPTGLMWVTVEADSGGDPSGTTLATSRIMDVSRLPTDKARMRFLFDSNTSITAGSTYYIIYQADYAASDTNYTTWWGLTSGGYANGSAKEFRGSWGSSFSLSGIQDLWFKTFVQNTPITAVTMPSGYDQRCLISYVFNDSNGKFKQYVQKDHNMVMGMGGDWRAFTSTTGLVEAVDLCGFLPPVPCSVQFVSAVAAYSPNVEVTIGGVACTDMPPTPAANATPIYTPGAMIANTRGFDIYITSYPAAIHDMIVVEDRTVLTRMGNSNCRIYVTMVTF